MTLEKYLQELQARADAGDTPAPMSLDDYMTLLQQRSDEFTSRLPAPAEPRLKRLPPLLTWFILPTDEKFVQLPEPPAPKPAPTPRRYRSSEDLHTERDRLAAKRDAIMFDGPADRAAANLATPARWKKLDRDIAAVAKLSKRIDRLDWAIRAAEYREKNAGQG
ncbi:hypothetical protein [Mycolicibacterium houstonense]|uniref:hypothetical protein n=1 Tax=Mycolicibacterium houstonense TaxID=146021 RepID=UPI003F9D2C81